jgi:copper(I)-binding protein
MELIMNSQHIKKAIAGATLALAALSAVAHSFKLGEIDIGHPYARPTREGQMVGAGYLKLANKGPVDRLVSATSPAAGSVEIHSMSMEGDVMKMRQIDAIEIATGQTVELKPGGYHLMLMGLKAPLKVGEKFPLTLKFEKSGEVVVTVNVEEPKSKSEATGAHKH